MNNLRVLVDKANQAYEVWQELKTTQKRQAVEDDAAWKAYRDAKDRIISDDTITIDEVRAVFQRLDAIDRYRISYTNVDNAAREYLSARGAAYGAMGAEFGLIHVDPFKCELKIEGPPT